MKFVVTKTQLVFILFMCATSLFTAAQPINPVTRQPIPPSPRVKTASVNIQANHDFYLTVNDKQYDTKILKAKPKEVRLKVGVHKLSFEEADSTGEKIEYFFRVTDDLVKRGDSTFTVDFKKDYTDIIKSFGNDLTNAGYEEATLNEQDQKLKNIVNELLSNMVFIQGGSYTMGNLNGQRDEVAHTVTVSPLNFGKYEITQRQWQMVMGYNKSIHQGCADCPVENVSWEEVNSFISALNQISVKKFRLPTEAEWEFVAKHIIEKEVGNPTHPEEFRKQWQSFIDKTTWYDIARKGTQPVGKKDPSLGIFDLLGNVEEWCFDYYKPDYQNDNAANPKGPATGEKRLIKGGSYKDKEDVLRVTLRKKESPSAKSRAVGFRLVSDAN